MKKAHVFTLALATVMSLCGLVGCNKGGGGDASFNFSVAIEGDYASLEVRDTPYLLKYLDNGVDNEDRTYTYSSNHPERASIVSTTGYITAKQPGTVTFTVKEARSQISVTKAIEVVAASPKASGGYNFSAAATESQRNNRTEILGKLEKYAMDTHLTGISLFENGGYMLYSDRAKALLGNRQYITGYGYGLLSDSDNAFTSKLRGSGVDTKYPYHYHTASSSDPLTINALDAAGSQVSDLSSYITSSYFSMKLNEGKNKAVWYATLADGRIHTYDESIKAPKMFHTGAHNDTDMYTGWRIYLRTNDQKVAYRFNGSAANQSKFNNLKVQLEDYEFILRFLLTGSHNLKRGNEMAADTSYGIKGAQRYNSETKNIQDNEECKKIWNQLKADGKLGIVTGHEDGTHDYAEGGKYPVGDYIEFTLLNPIDAFTAMYTLSSSLYSPIPESFMKMVGENKDGVVDGKEVYRAASRYGKFNNNNEVPTNLFNNIVESTICLGAYFLEEWVKKEKTVFTHNEGWWEYPDRYKIAGVRIKIDEAITENTDAYYDEFKAGNLDACSLPQKHMDEKTSAKEVEGDSVFKLNVNSCTEEQWEERFGAKGTISSGHTWNVKPWMSNDNFLNGLFWAIDRRAFAEKRGVRPSINYFSDSYMSDPQQNISYNSTTAHKNAVKNYHGKELDEDGNERDNYGYDLDKAISYFKTAVAQLVKENRKSGQPKLQYGTYDQPNEITIEIWWMYQSDISEYGVDIKSYFETAFNDFSVSQGRIKLNVINRAVTVWEYVYDQHLQVGEFDLGFGAISGNTYNPLNFLEVLKSDNSSTFTLNWGADTGAVDEKHPLVYGGEKYSFDALWEVADHGGVVEQGQRVKPVKVLYTDPYTTLKSSEDITLKLNSEFAQFSEQGKSAQFAIDNVSLYVYGGRSFGTEDGVYYDSLTGKIHLSAEALAAIEANIRTAIKWDDDTTSDKETDHLKHTYYGKLFVFDVTYSLSINGGQPTLNSIIAGGSSDDPLY